MIRESLHSAFNPNPQNKMYLLQQSKKYNNKAMTLIGSYPNSSKTTPSKSLQNYSLNGVK